MHHSTADATSSPVVGETVASRRSSSPAAAGGGGMRDIPQQFLQQAACNPHRIALQEMHRACTYGELARASMQMADTIAAVDAPEEAPVLVLGGLNAATASAVLGALCAGRMVSVLDHKAPDARLCEQIRTLGARMLCCTPATWARAASWGLADLHLAAIQEPQCVEESRESQLSSPAAPASFATADVSGLRGFQPGRSDRVRQINPEAPALFVLTSGSTGRAKATLQNHLRYLQMADWSDAEAGPAVRKVALLLPIAFEHGLGRLFYVLLSGRTGVMRDLAEHGIAGLTDWLQSQQIDELSLPVDVLRSWLGALPEKKLDLPVRMLGLSGRVYGRDLMRVWQRLPGCVCATWYTSTETARVAHMTHAPGSITDPDQIVPVGRTYPGIDVLLRDQDGNPVVAPNVAAAMYVRSPYLALGYLGEDSLTATRFRVVEGDARRECYTGDLGSIDADGVLHFHGRVDGVVKIHHRRVDLLEVERELMALPAVRSAAAYVSDAGSDRQSLAAVLVPSAGASLDSEFNSDAIRAALKLRLPLYMLPTDLRISEELPRTPTHKIDRAALPQFARHLPVLPESSAATALALRDETERRLADIWTAVLGTKIDDRSRDFYLSGGDSLLALRMLAQVEQQFGVVVMPGVFLRSSALAELAAILRDRTTQRASDDVLHPLRTGGAHAPLFIVPPAASTATQYQRLAAALSPDRPVYALLSHRFDSERPPQETIEETAARALDAIDMVRSRHPLILLGDCYGVRTVFEIAHRAVAAGRPPALLILQDPLAHRRWRRPKFENHPLDMLQELAEMLRYRQFRHMAMRIVHAVRMEMRRRQKGAAAAVYAVYRAQHLASWKYEIRPYAGRVLHIASEETARIAAVREFWQGMCRGAYSHVVLPDSTHRSIVKGQEGQRVAALLEAALSDASK